MLLQERQPAGDRPACAWCCRATTGNVGRSPATCWKVAELADPARHLGQGERREPHGALGQSRQRRDARARSSAIAAPARPPRQAAVGPRPDTPAARPGERLRPPSPRRGPPPASCGLVRITIEHDHRGAGLDQPLDQPGVDRSRPARGSAPAGPGGRPKRDRGSTTATSAGGSAGPRTRNSRRARRRSSRARPTATAQRTCPARQRRARSGSP